MAEYLPLDLLGDPVPKGKDKAGRPEHVATEDYKRVVMLLLAQDQTHKQIALALGISVPTLRKHYPDQLAKREEAAARLGALYELSLHDQALKGNVSALREVMERHEKRAAKRESDKMEAKQKRAGVKSKPLGKKAARIEDAQATMDGDFAPGPAPAEGTMH